MKFFELEKFRISCCPLQRAVAKLAHFVLCRILLAHECFVALESFMGGTCPFCQTLGLCDKFRKHFNRFLPLEVSESDESLTEFVDKCTFAIEVLGQ